MSSKSLYIFTLDFIKHLFHYKQLTIIQGILLILAIMLDIRSCSLILIFVILITNFISLCRGSLPLQMGTLHAYVKFTVYHVLHS